MAWVILDGTGTYGVGDTLLRPGANEVTDEAVLARLRKHRPRWIEIRDSREVEEEKPTAVHPPAKLRPFEKFRGRDGKWYFHLEPGEGEEAVQSLPYADEAAVDVAIAEAQASVAKIPTPGELSDGPASGMLRSEDLTKSEYPCEVEGCDKVCKTENGLRNHTRIKHPELFKK